MKAKTSMVIKFLSGSSFLVALFVSPASAECPGKEHVDTGIVMIRAPGKNLDDIEYVSHAGGILARIVDPGGSENRREVYFAHPILPPQGLPDTKWFRSYERKLDSLDILDSQKKWNSDFVDYPDTDNAKSGSIEVEFQRYRIERVGACKYRVWDVLLKESVEGSHAFTERMLYAPELQIVLRRGVAAGDSLPVLDSGFHQLQIKDDNS